MVWLADGEKILKICLFVLTECTNVTDGHTHTQTPHDGISHACIAKKELLYSSWEPQEASIQRPYK